MMILYQFKCSHFCEKASLKWLLDGAPSYGRVLLPLFFPLLKKIMRTRMKIDEQSAARSQARLEAAISRIDTALAQRRYLVGEWFSRADLTASALLQQLVLPGASDKAVARALPGALMRFRARYRTSRAFIHVAEMYDKHRRPEPTPILQDSLEALVGQ